MNGLWVNASFQFFKGGSSGYKMPFDAIKGKETLILEFLGKLPGCSLPNLWNIVPRSLVDECRMSS